MSVLMHMNIKPDSNPYYFAITARRLEKAYIHISHIEEMDAPPPPPPPPSIHPNV
jgi:hypothetical protein